MTEQENLLTVKQHLAAFEQENLEKALSYLDEQVDFQSPVSYNPPKTLKWAKPCSTRKEVEAYYKKMYDEVHPEKVETRDFIVKGDKVIVEGRNTCTVKSTKNTYQQNWIMVMKLDGGKIVRSHQYYDTAEILKAFES